MNYIFIAMLSLYIVMMGCMCFNRLLPEWFCKYLGWHLAPNQQGFDGCSASGKCPRCDKSVLQDSQGNWF